MLTQKIKSINKILSLSLIDARLAYILNTFKDKALVTTSLEPHLPYYYIS